MERPAGLAWPWLLLLTLPGRIRAPSRVFSYRQFPLRLLTGALLIFNSYGMKKYLPFDRFIGLAACMAAALLLPGCGNLGSHSLALRLQVAFDSTAIRIHNPTRATYYHTQVEVNDAFAAALGTIAPGGHRQLSLDSLRNDRGQGLSRRAQLERLTLYAQDSVGNYDALILDPGPAGR